MTDINPAQFGRPPAVETIVSQPRLQEAIERVGRPVVVDLIRNEIESRRMQAEPDKSTFDLSSIIEGVQARAVSYLRQFPQRVINGTGVLIHTNLGRAPWGREMLAAIAPGLTSYLSLEFDLNEGTRGKRSAGVEAALSALAGSEAALVVNNNAAAVYLTLSALAWNREVVISRGELVQIGGGFRIPDILAKSGAILREVGTTNKTNLADYEKACGPQTALILKVHRSNFTQTGFVSEVDTRELAALGKRRNVPVVWDIGSGAVGPGSVCQYTDEPTLAATVSTGVDLVTASGDKLLGGPQAGIIVGGAALIAQLRADPFYRALRPDKSTLLALELTVAAHRAGRAEELIPIYCMFALEPDALRRRAQNLACAAESSGWKASVIEMLDTPGGGAAPGKTIPGWGIRLTCDLSPDEVAARARQFDPPIIGTVSDEGFVLSMRTIFEDDEADILRFLKHPLQKNS